MSTSDRGAAGAVFDRMVQEGWRGVEGWVTSARQESLHLDFKQAERPELRGTTRGDRKQLSKALSGFANADGGVLVFGVEAKPDPERDGLDCVKSIVPIRSIAAFRSELEGSVPEMVQWMVQGVEFALIESPGEPDTGVLLILIPASDRTPHMAVGPSLNGYFRRDARSFRSMSHDEVADAFGRRPRPVLTWDCEHTVQLLGPANNPFVELSVSFYLTNAGRAVARFPCLSVSRPAGWKSSPGPVSSGLPLVQAPTGVLLRYAGGAGSVIYPGDRLKAGHASFRVSERDTDHGPMLFEIQVSTVADRARPEAGWFRLSKAQIGKEAEEALMARPEAKGFRWME